IVSGLAVIETCAQTNKKVTCLLCKISGALANGTGTSHEKGVIVGQKIKRFPRRESRQSKTFNPFHEYIYGAGLPHSVSNENNGPFRSGEKGHRLRRRGFNRDLLR